MKIYCDVDNVVVNFSKEYCRRINLKYGTNWNWEKLNHVDANRICKHSNGYEFLKEPNFYSKVELMVDAKHYIEKLIEKFDKNFFFVTKSINEFSLVDKFRIIKHNFPQINMGDQYLVLADRSLISGNDVILIDDSLENLENSNAGCKICFGWHYNRHFKEDMLNTIRCENWYQIYEFLRRFK